MKKLLFLVIVFELSLISFLFWEDHWGHQPDEATEVSSWEVYNYSGREPSVSESYSYEGWEIYEDPVPTELELAIADSVPEHSGEFTEIRVRGADPVKILSQCSNSLDRLGASDLFPSPTLPPAEKGTEVPKEVSERKMTVRTTAYTHTEADHLKYGRKTAIGTTLKYGSEISAAADWSFLPLGTKFQISGRDEIYTVEDYGSALVGTETIDIYHPTKSSMNKWGVRHVDIEIIEWGSFEKSREILKSRTFDHHCKKMYDSLLALSD
ncbi:3D domain-containing protein [Candidatus Pacebacteria bacterium]|nr:3D domain-containing protein [Candidatus Paceibacterota bacterium]